MTPGSWRAASVCRTWLWWRYLPRRAPIRRGARARACRWHTDWRGQGRLIHPELHQPACFDEMTWSSGKTLRTPDLWCRMRLYGLCKMGSLGALACRWIYRSRRYRMLWLRRSKRRRCASFRRNSGLFFQQDRPVVLCLALKPNCSSRISPWAGRWNL